MLYRALVLSGGLQVPRQLLLLLRHCCSLRMPLVAVARLRMPLDWRAMLASGLAGHVIHR